MSKPNKSQKGNPSARPPRYAPTAAAVRNKAKQKETGKQAGKEAKEDVAKLARSVGLTPKLVLSTIAQGLKANSVQPRFSEKVGRFAYSKPLVDHATRLKAADMGATILELKPKDDKDAGKAVRIVVETNV